MWLGSLRESQFRYRRNEGMQLQLAQMAEDDTQSAASVQVRLPRKSHEPMHPTRLIVVADCVRRVSPKQVSCVQRFTIDLK
ncbi:MAG: hypothetical protein RJP95_01165 [Pirellulales bacterium]